MLRITVTSLRSVINVQTALCLFSGFGSEYALVNNGVFYNQFYRPGDEFDVTFQTNYLGKIIYKLNIFSFEHR